MLRAPQTLARRLQQRDSFHSYMTACDEVIYMCVRVDPFRALMSTTGKPTPTSEAVSRRTIRCRNVDPLSSARLTLPSSVEWF